MVKPVIRLWDIETSPNVLAAFRLLNFNILPHDSIIQERYIICASWMDLDSDEVHSVSVLDNPKLFAKNPHSDKHVVNVLHEALSQADAIVAHNGDDYDIKFTETRMLAHGLSPLPPIPSIDTLKVAKSRFLFNSNKLDYIGRLLGVGKKIKTDSELWMRVLQGDIKAIKEMLVYNKQDTKLLKAVFLKLQPYAPKHFNVRLLAPADGKLACPRCGGHHIQHRGYHYTLVSSYPRYQCMDCAKTGGGWFRDKKADRITRERVL